jgi:DNA-binding transcriptional LysR family regulator
MGAGLVDRTAHPAVLTAAGKCFLPLLKGVIASLEAARIKSRLAHDQAAASLRFAATHVLSMYFFPRWLASLERKIRIGPVQTMSDSSQSCEDLMLQRRVQFMLCYGHPNAPNRMDEGKYPMLLLGKDLLVPVSASGTDGQPVHDLEKDDVLPILGYSDQSGLGRIVRSQLNNMDQDATGAHVLKGTSVVFTAHNAVLLKTMAIEGRGLAWLPKSLISDELQTGSLRESGGTRWQIPIDIRLYRQPTEMVSVAEALWKAASS